MVNLINTLYNLSTFIGISTDSGRVLPDVYSGWNDVYISTHVRMWENVTISSQNHRWNNDADGLQSHFSRSTQSKVPIQANTCMFLPMYIFIKRKHIYYIHVCVQWYSQVLRWFPILALVSGLAPSICKHDLGNIRLGNSVIFTTKGWENHITDNNVIITTSTTTLFSFFSLQQQVTFVAYSPSEYDALTHVLRQTNSGASCGSAASSNAGTLPNLPLKNHWVCKRSFQVSSI